MGSKTTRLVFLGVLGFVVSLALAGFAYASTVAPHITLASASSPGLSASLASTGDAGGWPGSWNWATSPVLPAPPVGFGGWFNQDVEISGLEFPDHLFIPLSAWYRHSADGGASWDVTQSFSATGSVIVSAEGLYSITATGVNNPENPTITATGTIVPVAGIDKTKPMSFSDVVPVYSGAATVTITATDTLSGIDTLQYSADGGPLDFSWDASGGVPFQVPVAFGPGAHALSWKAFDNAGNTTEGSAAFIVRPVGFSPRVNGLKVTRVKTSRGHHHKAKFTGSVTPLASSATLTLTVKKYSAKRKSYRSFKTFKLTVAKYASAYSMAKSFTSNGRYEVRASFSHGKATKWKKWTVN